MSIAAAAIKQHQSETHVSSLPAASPIEIFRERAEARAVLCANGLMPLQDTVDGLQEVAAAQGLLREYGQDSIQAILAESFGRWRF
jgi:hypothetical protein